MPNYKIVPTVVFAALALCAASSHAQCGPERYFAPTDAANEQPLSVAHPEFQKTKRLATRGDAVEARNLGAFYDTGYLVTRCRELAAHWYGKAAELGDAAAKEWIDQHTALKRLRSGPECYSDACVASEGAQRTVVRSGPGGGYKVSVKINGKTVQGLIDTGASVVAMSAKMAQELGIAYSTGRQRTYETANGRTTGRDVVLDAITVGGITLKNVAASVGDADHQLLVGMSFLKRLTISTSGGAMVLATP